MTFSGATQRNHAAGLAGRRHRALLSGTAVAALVATGLFSPITLRPADAASECGVVAAGNPFNVACGTGPFTAGVTYGNAQTGLATSTAFTFAGSQVTNTTGAFTLTRNGVSLSSNAAGRTIDVSVNNLSSITGGTGTSANGFVTTTSGANSGITFTLNSGAIQGGTAVTANGVLLTTSGTGSAVTFDMNAGTVTGGAGATSHGVSINTNNTGGTVDFSLDGGTIVGGTGLAANGVNIRSQQGTSDITFGTAAGTSITAASGNGVTLSATGGSSIDASGSIDGTITSTLVLSGNGIGTGFLAQASGGNGDVEAHVGTTGNVSGTGAGLIGTAVGTGAVTLDIDGQVHQTSTTGSSLNAGLFLLPVGVGGSSSGSGTVTITSIANSSITQVGSTPLIPTKGAGMLAVNTGTGAAVATANGAVSATGIGVGSITTGGNADATTNIGGNITVTGGTGASPLGTVSGGAFDYTVGALAVSGNGTAAVNFKGGNITGTFAGANVPDVGGLSLVAAGAEDALINIGDGTADASTINATHVGLFAINNGSGDAKIDADQLDQDDNQNTVNSGGTGMLSVATGSGDAAIDTGIINSNLSGNGGFGTLFTAILSGNPTTIATALPDSGSGAIAFAAGGGDASVTNYGEITANDGAFGAAAISFGGDATVTARANIDPPDIGMFPFTIGAGNAVGTVIDGVTVDSNYVGTLAGNIGTGSVTVDVGDDTINNVGAAVKSDGVGIFLLKDGGVDGATDNVINVHRDSSVIGDVAGIVISAGLVGGDGNTAVINNDGLIQGNLTGVTLPAPFPPIPVLQVGVISAYTDGGLTINNGVDFPQDAIIQGEEGAAGTTIAGTSDDLGAFELAIATAGGGTTVNNGDYGIITGNVALLSNDQNVFNNAFFGEWNTGGINFMGFGADDEINNEGYIRTHLVTGFVNLENFNNFDGGVLTMQDGQVNDLTGTDGNFNGGNFNLDSTLDIDAFLTPGGVADVLAIGATVDITDPNLIVNTGGNLTGATYVYVNDLDNGPGQYDPTGVLFALEGGSPNDGGTFYTDGGIDKGLFRYDVYRRDAATTQNTLGFTEWVLASTPNQIAQELPIVASGANELWNISTGTWLDRTADLRSAFGTDSGVANADIPAEIAGPNSGYGAWFRAYGGTQSRDNDVTVSAPAGLIGPDQEYDDGYTQNFLGFMTGFDFVREGNSANGKNTAWIFGVMAGYGGSNLNFDGSDSDVDYKAGSVGAYVTYLNGGFFVDGTVKADFGKLDFSSNAGGGGFSGDFDSNYTSIGFVIDTGYRMNMSSGWFFEPKATISYVNTDFDDASLAGSDVSFDNGDSFKGRLGGRLGRKSDHDGKVLEGFIEASVWDEFDGDYSVNLSGGGFDADVSKDLGGVYGEVAGGVNLINTTNGWSGFAKAAVQFGEDNMIGVTGNLGVRKSW